MSLDGIFNSPFMLKLQEAGQKLGQNTFVSSLSAAMMSQIPVIMVGSVFQILCIVLADIFGVISPALRGVLYTPYQFTMGMLALWVVVILGYNYSKNLRLRSPIISAVSCAVCMIMISGALSVNDEGVSLLPTTFLSFQGMFVAILVAFCVVRIEKLCVDRKIYIRMPEVVPPYLQDSFAAIVPLTLASLVFLLADHGISVATGGAYGICTGFMALLQKPLGAVNSVPGLLLLFFFAGIMWAFGIHGTIIITPIMTMLEMQAWGANADAYATGGMAALAFYPIFLEYGLYACGGTGNTFPVVIYGLFRAKSEQYKAVARVGAIPSLFGVNEPITFGMPVMYNPILCIPYILSIPVSMLFYYIGYKTGIIVPSFVYASFTMIGVQQYLESLNIMNMVWALLNIIPMSLVWFPFCAAYDKQLCQQEAAKAALEETAAA